MIRYNQISKWELKKYVWCKCRFETNNWKILEWVIYENYNRIWVFSNKYLDGMFLMDWNVYKYGYIIYTAVDSVEKIDNVLYQRIEIEEVNQEQNIKPLKVEYRFYAVYVEWMNAPRVIHNTLEDAQKEAKRLTRETAKNSYVCEIVNKYGVEVVEKNL